MRYLSPENATKEQTQFRKRQRFFIVDWTTEHVLHSEHIQTMTFMWYEPRKSLALI